MLAADAIPQRGPCHHRDASHRRAGPPAKCAHMSDVFPVVCAWDLDDRPWAHVDPLVNGSHRFSTPAAQREPGAGDEQQHRNSEALAHPRHRRRRRRGDRQTRSLAAGQVADVVRLRARRGATVHRRHGPGIAQDWPFACIPAFVGVAVGVPVGVCVDVASQPGSNNTVPVPGSNVPSLKNVPRRTVLACAARGPPRLEKSTDVADDADGRRPGAERRWTPTGRSQCGSGMLQRGESRL